MERVLSELALGLRARGSAVTVVAVRVRAAHPARASTSVGSGPEPAVRARPIRGSCSFGSLVATPATARRRPVDRSDRAEQVEVVGVHYCQQAGPATASRRGVSTALTSSVAGLLGRSAERVYYRADGSEAFVCVSEGVAEEMREYFPAFGRKAPPRSTTASIPRPSRPVAVAGGAAAERARLGIAPEPARGNVRRRRVGTSRGCGSAIGALALAAGWELVVVGAGDRDRYAADRRARSASPARFTGRASRVTSRRSTSSPMRSFFPTSYEAFSLVALEAAASGLPMLATPVNGVRELVRDGENGFLVAARPRRDRRAAAKAGGGPRRCASGSARRRARGVARVQLGDMVDRHESCTRACAERAGRRTAGAGLASAASEDVAHERAHPTLLCRDRTARVDGERRTRTALDLPAVSPPAARSAHRCRSRSTARTGQAPDGAAVEVVRERHLAGDTGSPTARYSLSFGRVAERADGSTLCERLPRRTPRGSREPARRYAARQQNARAELFAGKFAQALRPSPSPRMHANTSLRELRRTACTSSAPYT